MKRKVFKNVQKMKKKNNLDFEICFVEYFDRRKALRVLPAETGLTVYRRSRVTMPGMRKTIFENFSSIRFVLDSLEVHHDILGYPGITRRASSKLIE